MKLVIASKIKTHRKDAKDAKKKLMLRVKPQSTCREARHNTLRSLRLCGAKKSPKLKPSLLAPPPMAVVDKPLSATTFL
ncbi:MAG: hypothetical protein ACOZBW_03870 [Thermodesulfobacteriota bacterium]